MVAKNKDGTTRKNAGGKTYVPTSIYLPSEVRDLVDTMAQKEGITRSRMVREIIFDFYHNNFE